MQDSVWIESRGYRMLGILEYDDAKEIGKDLVVLIHGFVGTKIEPHRMYRKLSERLSKKGFTVMRFDFVGSGDSDGSFEDMTIMGEVEDGLNVIEYLKNNYNVKNLYIVGFSMGGCVASILASKSQCDGLVLWSPVSNPFWNFYHIFGHDSFIKGIKGNKVDYLGDVVGEKFFDELLESDPLKYAMDYNNPVLIIHGTEDMDVLPVNAYCYNKVFLNSSIHFVEGADHCYSSFEFEKELLDNTVEFLTKLKERQFDAYAY